MTGRAQGSDPTTGDGARTAAPDTATPAGAWTAHRPRLSTRLVPVDASGPRRLAVGIGGAVLGVAGAALLIRPLTALLVLGGVLAAAAVLAGVAVARRRTLPAWWRRPLGVLLVILGALAAAGLPVTIRAVPVLAIAALMVGAAVQVRRMVRPATGRERILAAARAIAALAAAGLTWAWPDLASIALAAGLSLGMLVRGAILLVRALRTAPRRALPPRRALSPRAVGRPSLVHLVGASVLAVALAAGSASSVSLVARAEAVDAFYSWSGPIPATPGAVLRTAPYAGAVPSRASAVRILYATTHGDGTPALASAVLAYPDGPASGPRPVLAWQHGTTGVARACGPSVGPDALTETAIPGISRAIDRGWAVVATDYPGQGTEGRYPYLIGQGEGRATLDAARAAGRVDAAHASSDVWLWGHSQGGHATLWAGQIAAEYAPELTVLGVAALSAASDPLALAERVTGADAGPVSDIVTSFVAVPYSQEYADMRLPSLVHPAGLALVDAAASRCVTSPTTAASALTALAIGQDAPLYRIDLSAGPARERLADNRADGEVDAPLFLGQGTADEVIPLSMQQRLVTSLCERGRPVSAHEYPGRSHMGVIAADSPLIEDLFAWVDAVERGGAPSTCPG